MYTVQLNPLTEARLLKVIAFLTALLFLIIELLIIQAAKTGQSPNDFYWVFILVGILVIYPFIEMALDKKKKP
jgi:archaellum biogenesis protein FlaJ (TadC family)